MNSLKLATVTTLSELRIFSVAHRLQGEAYREFDAAKGKWVSTQWAGASGAHCGAGTHCGSDSELCTSRHAARRVADDRALDD